MRTLLSCLALLLGCSDASVKAFNATPEALISVPADGDRVSADTSTLLRGVVSDPDDGAAALLATWLVDGREVCTATRPDDDGITECAATLAEGDRRITLEVRDSRDAAASDAIEVTAESTAGEPVVLEVQLSPNTAQTDDTLTATVQVRSGDVADGWTLAWQVDGAPVDATGDTLDGTLHFDKGQSVVAVAALDAEAWSSPPVRIENTVPTAPGLTLALEGEHFVCRISTPSEDADDDAVDYALEWALDGVALTGAERIVRTGDAVQAASLVGTELRCTATPSDDESDGPSASTTIAVCAVGRGTETCPGESCQQLLEDGIVTTSGLAWIAPDGIDPFAVYCDMELETGGWALAGSYTFDTWSTIDHGDVDQVQTGGGAPVLPDDTLQHLRFFDHIPHSEVLVTVSKNGAAPDWMRMDGDIADIDSEAEICEYHQSGEPRYCSTDTPNTYETSTGESGTCTGVAGADNWVRSEGHHYAGQWSTYLFVCGYGPSVCPPNGYAGCGFADTALRLTEVQQDAYWGSEGDTFVTRFYLR